MKLSTYYNSIELHREAKIIYVKFLTPHRVLSTCRSVAGGLRDDLRYLYNHQSCEPSGHHLSAELYHLAVYNPNEYRRVICEQYGLPSEECASMGTAANMNNAGISHEVFQDVEVVAICTGGVETNAGRAGDPAAYHQQASHFEQISQEHGTIVTMLCISRELTPGAMVSAAITATEAKTAVLQELRVPSRYSDGLATGTGTDQIGIATRLHSGLPLTDAGKHSKLGELIGQTVYSAIRQTLALQNGLTPNRQCSTLAYIERFGGNRETMCAGISEWLSTEQAELFQQNFLSLNNDPPTVAAVAALVHLNDTFTWSILPQGCQTEIFTNHGTQIAVAVSGKYDRWLIYRQILAETVLSIQSADLLRCIYRAYAIGFADKWSNP